MRRRLAVTGLALLLIAAVVLLTRPWEIPIGAGQRVERAYSARWAITDPGTERCMTVAARGAVEGTWRRTVVGGTSWSDVRVVNPTVIVTGGTRRGASCDTTTRLEAQAGLVQAWSADGCALAVDPMAVDDEDPTIVRCPADRTDQRASDEGPAAGPLRQFNSGAPVVFDGGVVRFGDGALPLHGDVMVLGRVGDDDLQQTRLVTATLRP